MARGLWVSPSEFVKFAEPNKTLTEQIASRSRSIDFFGLGMYLPNPDPILKSQGRDIRIYRELRTDPLVGGCIRRRKAAVKSLERGLERGHAPARVFSFIRDMLDDLDLSRIIGEMTDAVLYGYQPTMTTGRQRLALMSFMGRFTSLGVKRGVMSPLNFLPVRSCR